MCRTPAARGSSSYIIEHMRSLGFPYFAFTLLIFLCAMAPWVASAHEVYVLTPETIAHDIGTPSPNPIDAFGDNRMLFFFSAFAGFVFVSTIFFASITHRLEIFFEPWFTRMRPWAPLVARVTLGLCLIASAYNGALFGPELPLSNFGAYAPLAQWALYISGTLIALGIATRGAALLAGVVFLAGVGLYGSYMLNYTNYLGMLAVVAMLGGGLLSLRAARGAHSTAMEGYAFLVLRIAFGISVAYAAIYAKFIHSNLALSTVSEYNLTAYFPFDPLFIVLGACIIEVLMGVFYIVGFEIRHTSLFFLFWIFLSFIYFGESVWPHLVFVGVNVALIMYGYDKWTIQGRFFNRGKLQPFL